MSILLRTSRLHGRNFVARFESNECGVVRLLFSILASPVSLECGWSSYIEHDPSAAIALTALESALPARLLTGSHVPQLTFDHWWGIRRWRLLEAGLVFASLPRLGKFPKRLVSNEYGSVLAELDAALVLWALGFKIIHEPVKTLKLAARVNPDWLAIRDNRCFGVEVKCPHVSENVLGRENVVAEIMRTNTLVAPEISMDLHLEASGLRAVTNGSWSNNEKVQDLLLDALVVLEKGDVARNELGEFRRTSKTTRYEEFSIDESAELARLRSDIEDAAWQLKPLSPGIVFVSTGRDAMVRHRSYAIRDFLTEHWARELACVLVVSATSPGFIVECIPGARFGELPELRAPICEHKHSHIDIFKPRSPCTAF